MRTMTKVVSAVVVLLLVAGSADAGITFFLSDKGLGEGATVTNPSITLPNVGATTSLYIWAIPDEKVIGTGMNLISIDSAILEATAVELYNPVYDIVFGPPLNITLEYKRWKSPVGTGAMGDLWTNMNAVAISVDENVTGLDPDFSGADPMYDAVAGAWLFGRVDVEATAEGSTDLYLTVSSNFIAPAAGFGADLPVWFGAGETSALHGESVDVQSEFADGSVTVVPEPVTLSILGLGVLGLLRRRR